MTELTLKKALFFNEHLDGSKGMERKSICKAHG